MSSHDDRGCQIPFHDNGRRWEKVYPFSSVPVLASVS